jgi:hypothetical protein
MQGQVDALLEKAEQRRARPEERPPVAQGPPPRPLDPKDFDTTIAQVRRMAQKDVHPTWMHAAYADLAQRLARVEDLLEVLDASMSLLHTKMETLIGQLAVSERQDRAE